MRATSIHLIYGSLLAAIFAGILHFQYCHKAVIDQYNQLASADIQLLHVNYQLLIAKRTAFVEEYDEEPCKFYLEKLCGLDSILDRSFQDLTNIPVGSLDSYDAVFKKNMKTLFQNEKYSSILETVDTIHFTKIDRELAKNNNLPAMKQLQYYVKTAGIRKQVLDRISSTSWRFTKWYPALFPLSGPQNLDNSYSFNIAASKFSTKNEHYIINHSTRLITDGPITIDTIFPKPGWYPFYAQVTTGGRFRTPAITQYDTIFVHVLPK